MEPGGDTGADSGSPGMRDPPAGFQPQPGALPGSAPPCVWVPSRASPSEINRDVLRTTQAPLREGDGDGNGDADGDAHRSGTRTGTGPRRR